MSISLIEVTNRKQLLQFIRFQRTLLGAYAGFVPPLERRELKRLDPSTCAFLDTCEFKLWMAMDGHRPVGRIAAIINDMTAYNGQERSARFSHFDFIDDKAVSAGLLRAAEEWSYQKGVRTIRGPLGFTGLDPAGMLTEGFNSPGGFTTLFNPSYYPEHVLDAGYQPEAEWKQYEFPVPEKINDRLYRIAETIEKRLRLTVVKLNSKEEKLALEHKMMTTYQETFHELYQAVPLSEQQQAYYVKEFSNFMVNDLVCMITDENDQLVAFALSVPSLVKSLQKANGRFFPFGWWHIMRAFRQNDTVEMLIIGVKKEYQSKGVTAIVFRELWSSYINRGYRRAVGNPELIDNTRVLNLWGDYEKTEITRRKTFVKSLA